MGMFRRKEQKQVLQESGARQRQLDITDLIGLPYYQFTTAFTSLRNSTANIASTLKEAMLNDPIISMVINMWISDTLHMDLMSQKIFDVEIKKNDDSITDKQIDDLNRSIDYLIENSNLDELLIPLLYEIIKDGIANVRFGFVDTYEDTKIKLFESNKKRLLSESETWQRNKETQLLEAPTYDDYADDSYKSVHKMKNKKRRLNGRYYFELLPSRLVPLKHKGITVLYLDLGNSLKVLNPRNITTFVNTRGGVKKLSIKKDPQDIMSDVYEIPLGKSFIENSVTPWSMLNTTEDCTLLALMTRSSVYRLFQIDVGSLSNKETDQLILDFKKRLTTRETVNVREKHYSSAQTQIPLGDSIIVPTRNGIGTINVQAIGGDLDIKTNSQLDYFRDQLLASLGVPKQLIYGDESGSLINTSATRQDIRYLRTIQQFTSILSLGLEDIFKDYLSLIGKDLRKISLKVKFVHLNSEEALQRIEYEQTKQEALDRAVTSLNNLGINFENGQYIKTRDELIKRFMDQDLLEIIHLDEKTAPQVPQVPADGNSDHESLPSGTLDNSEATFDDMQNTDTSLGKDLPDEPTTSEEPEQSDDVNANPPYTVG